MPKLKNKRVVRFVLIGGVCFLTNLAVLYVGTDILGWYYLLSMAVSIIVANSLGWLLNRNWTFPASRFSWWMEYGRYMSVSFSSTLISLLLMILCVSVFGMHYLLASASIALAMISFNFIVHRDWSFAASKDPVER
ncbi:MAG TPA: GtrA family protein [Rhodocyclaceae bacterium]|nr:GtrA family protein [Rhodocyclaceae bacterium]